MVGRLGVVAVVAVSLLAAAVGSASAAAAPPTQHRPRSAWVVPGAAPLDGLGAFLFVNAPAAGPAQTSVLGYEYSMLFGFENNSVGVMALGYKGNQKVAGFGLMPSNPLVATVPFDWQFGRIYYLLTYRIATDVWAAWVYDYSVSRWTHIASLRAPGIGRMRPTPTTGVEYSATPTSVTNEGTCAIYPRVDAFWYPPTGWRGNDMTTATLVSGDTVSAGECPGTVRTSDGWQYYALGSAPAA